MQSSKVGSFSTLFLIKETNKLVFLKIRNLRQKRQTDIDPLPVIYKCIG